MIKYVPKQAQGEGALFSGFLELETPKNTSRLELMSMMNIQIGQDGVELMKTTKDLAQLAPLLSHSKKFYQKVELKKGDVEYKSFDDLDADSDCMNLMIEVLMLFMGGYSPGKN